MRNTARTVGAVLAAAAGIMMLGAPAFAQSPQLVGHHHHHHDSDEDDPSIDHNHVYNGVNTGNEANVQTVTGACTLANTILAPINAVGGLQLIPTAQTVGNCASGEIHQ